MEDIRDEELGRLLDEWASLIEPDPSVLRGLPPRRPRRDRVVRLTASIAVAAVFVAAAAWGVAVVGRDSADHTEGPTAPSLKTFTDPRSIPITVAYPADWFAAPNSGHSWLDGNGLVVVNDRREMWRALRDGPFGTHIRDFVGVTVFKAPNHAPTPTDSSFPLDMADAKVDPGWGQESVRYLNAQVAGVPIRIMVLAAKDASLQNIAAADAIVASIRPTGTASPQIATAPLMDHGLSRPASEIAAAGGYIWAAENVTDTVQKVNPSTGEVVATLPMIGNPTWLAGGDSVLWVGIYGDEIMAVVGIDTATNETVLTVHGVTGPLVQTDEGLWGYERRTPNPDWMVVLDPQTGDAVRHVEVSSQPFAAAASGRSVWLLDMEAGTVSIVSDDGSVRVVTDRSSGSWLAASDSGVYLSAWRGDSANDQNGPATSAFGSLDGQVQPFGDIYNFRPMVVTGDRVWFVAGPHDGDISGLCGMRTVDGVVDRCADIPVGLEGVHDPVAFDPTTGTLWATAWDQPKLYEVDAG
jgi:hypothetical protein